MKLSALKGLLKQVSQLDFTCPDGTPVPRHFHLTEIGVISRQFVDCGGTTRTQKTVSLQLWVSDDLDHRLSPSKFEKIIALSERQFVQEDMDIEVEYMVVSQGSAIVSTPEGANWQTVGRFGLDFNNGVFVLTPTRTQCLAGDLCGIPATKSVQMLSDLTPEGVFACSSDSACC